MAKTNTSCLICSVKFFFLIKTFLVALLLFFREIVVRQILIMKYFFRVALNALVLKHS